MNFEYVTTREHAPEILKWLRERGGILVWPNGDLRSMRQIASFTVPYRNESGEENLLPPNWRCRFTNPYLIADISKVGFVETDKRGNPKGEPLPITSLEE